MKLIATSSPTNEGMATVSGGLVQSILTICVLVVVVVVVEVDFTVLVVVFVMVKVSVVVGT